MFLVLRLFRKLARQGGILFLSAHSGTKFACSVCTRGSCGSVPDCCCPWKASPRKFFKHLLNKETKKKNKSCRRGRIFQHAPLILAANETTCQRNVKFKQFSQFHWSRKAEFKSRTRHRSSWNLFVESRTCPTIIALARWPFAVRAAFLAPNRAVSILPLLQFLFSVAGYPAGCVVMSLVLVSLLFRSSRGCKAEREQR